ncbi:TfpX/TfpZ family type IV pilin accessory protein [Acinetobacter sp. YH12100]|uniref:TfpX/TfpZ family type IV pilin accessory protein n=1 Tax=Acinetobacter sp. YH12100 TaxID=2601089 RepID=UPI0015D1851A|nr:TfpX/TfpZ family type IV pilin accessory protein [Acinetobacter sp. YH12100]
MSKRLKFFLTHLVLSSFVVLLLILFIIFVWYPQPLGRAVGVLHILFMLLIIDVIIGPFLGFIVYKDGKKSLKFDLSIVILFQLMALGYGIYSVEQGRPAWIVYHGNQFELVRKNEIIFENIEKVQKEYQKVSWLGPQFVAIGDTQNDDVFLEVVGGISIAQMPVRYFSINNMLSNLILKSNPISNLYKYNHGIKVKKILLQYPQADGWIPLKATSNDMVVLLNKETKTILAIVDLRPWK